MGEKTRGWKGRSQVKKENDEWRPQGRSGVRREDTGKGNYKGRAR